MLACWQLQIGRFTLPRTRFETPNALNGPNGEKSYITLRTKIRKMTALPLTFLLLLRRNVNSQVMLTALSYSSPLVDHSKWMNAGHSLVARVARLTGQQQIYTDAPVLLSAGSGSFMGIRLIWLKLYTINVSLQCWMFIMGCRLCISCDAACWYHILVFS